MLRSLSTFGLAVPAAFFTLVSALGACSTDSPEPRIQDRRPQRIVSLDYCADQYVLNFVERDRILAVSPDAARDFSYMRERAAGLPTVRPVAEDVIILKPDLVVRAYGGGPRATATFLRAGVPVHEVPWAEDIESVTRVIVDTARALGSADQGMAVAARMQARLAALPGGPGGVEALYMTPAGVTSGPGFADPRDHRLGRPRELPDAAGLAADSAGTIGIRTTGRRRSSILRHSDQPPGRVEPDAPPGRPVPASGGRDDSDTGRLDCLWGMVPDGRGRGAGRGRGTLNRAA